MICTSEFTCYKKGSVDLKGRSCCGANFFFFAAGLTLRGHESDLFQVLLLFLTRFISDAMQFNISLAPTFI